MRARDIVQEGRAGVKEGKDRHVIEILLCGRETSFKRTELESKKERTDMRTCCVPLRKTVLYRTVKTPLERCDGEAIWNVMRICN